MIKVYPIYTRDADWLINHSPDIFEKVNNLVQADMVILPGGADWNPKLYDELPHPKTSPYAYNDYDQLLTVFKSIVSNKYFIGICRGAQGLCILNGGKLIQDVTNHAGYSHDITTKTGDTFWTNSLHHQMLDLNSIPEVNWDLLAWSSKPLSKHYEGALGASLYTYDGLSYKDLITHEPEIVKFTDIYGLGIQGHPEMDSMSKYTLDFIIRELLISYGEFQNNGKSPKHNYNRNFISDRLDNIVKVLISNRSEKSITDLDKTIFNRFIKNENEKFKIKAKKVNLFLEQPKNESRSKQHVQQIENRDKLSSNRGISRKECRWEY